MRIASLARPACRKFSTSFV